MPAPPGNRGDFGIIWCMTGELLIKKERWFLRHNNWIGKLPDDNFPPVSGEPKVRPGWFREVVDRNGGMNLIIGINCRHKQGHSELYLGQTYRAFFLTIDRLIEETGVRDVLDRYIELTHTTDLGYQGSIWKLELERLSEPVIRQMLEMGYAEYDLGS